MGSELSRTDVGRGYKGCPHPVAKGLGVVTPGSSLVRKSLGP